jgi:hypothetical protein
VGGLELVFLCHIFFFWWTFFFFHILVGNPLVAMYKLSHQLLWTDSHTSYG